MCQLIVDYLIANHETLKEQVRHVLAKAEDLKKLDPIFADEIDEQATQQVIEILLETIAKDLPVTAETAMVVIESLDLKQLYYSL